MESATQLPAAGGQAQALTLPDISTLHISHRGDGDTRNCHLKWIEEFMPSSLSLDQKRTRVQRHTEEGLKRYEEFKDVVSTSFARIGQRLLLAAFSAYNSDFERAAEWIDKSWEYLETNVKSSGSEPESHVKALTYLVMANCQMMMSMSQGSFRSRALQRSNPLELNDSDKLNEMEGLAGGDRVFQALIVAAKGMVAKVMRCQEKHIALIEQATKLNPGCAEWLRILYLGLRHRRRTINPGTVPSAEEKTTITKAYEMTPDFCLSQALYAGMLEEELSFSRVRDASQKETLRVKRKQTVDEVIKLWENSLRVNPKDRWTRVRLAEMHAYGKYPHLEGKEGERLFQDIIRDYPEFSTVYHKYGKYFYLTGQFEKAFEYYKKALDIDMSNHPCLMDYLKAALRMGVTRQGMLTTVETVLSQSLLNKIPWLKIMTLRGILLWLIDEDGAKKSEACGVWIEAAARYSSQADRLTIINYINMTEWNVIGKYSINFGEVVCILRVRESLLNQQHTSTSAVTGEEEFEKRRRIIGEFIRDIEGLKHDVRTTGEGIPFGSKSINNNPRHSNGCHFQSKRLSGGQGDRGDSNSDSNESWRTGSPSTLQASNTGKLRAPRYPPTPTAADLECNWRG